MQKYVELPKSDANSKVENDWLGVCQRNSIPFITLKCRTKLADVHWDHITYQPDIDKLLNNLDGKLRDGAIAIFEKYANSRSEYRLNDFLVWFKNIEIPEARMAAEELYDLIVSFIESGKAC